MSDKAFIDDGSDAAELARTYRPGRKVGVTRSTSIVPEKSVAGRTLLLLIAIMTFLSCVTLGGVWLIQKSAIAWSADVGQEVTILVRPIDGTTIDDALAAAASIARAIPGVGTIQTLSDDDSKALLEPWLGAGLDLNALAVPRMLVVQLSDPREVNLEQMAGNLQQVPGASLETHSAWQEQLNTMSGTMVLSGLLVLVLIITATVLAIIFATRGTMASNRAIVDVLHFIGASNRFIAREFQGRFLGIGLRGALVGALSALLFFLLISVMVASYASGAAGNQLSILFGRFALGWDGIIALVLVVPVIAGLTAITSRLTVQQFLRQIS